MIDHDRLLVPGAFDHRVSRGAFHRVRFRGRFGFCLLVSGEWFKQGRTLSGAASRTCLDKEGGNVIAAMESPPVPELTRLLCPT